jgi:F-box domain
MNSVMATTNGFTHLHSRSYWYTSIVAGPPPALPGGPPIGYHSATPFIFTASQEAAIVRTTTYNRKDYALSVVYYPVHEHWDVQFSLTSAFRRPCCDLGKLQVLPVEILHTIFRYLDIPSIFRLRHVNLRLREVIDSMIEMKQMMNHCRNTLCAVLRLKLASSVTVTDFHRLLRNPKCSTCETKFAQHVFLPTWQRCCQKCLHSGNVKLAMITPTNAEAVLPEFKEEIAELPVVKVIPGNYSMDQVPNPKRRQHLICVQLLLSMYLKKTELEKPDARVERDLEDRLLGKNVDAYKACCTMPVWNPHAKKEFQIQHGVSCAGCQLALENGTIRDGSDMRWAMENRDKVYSKEQYLSEHFFKCEQAQRLWLASRDGTIFPEFWPKSCKYGGFFKDRDEVP